MSYHPTVQKIIDILNSHSVWYETFEHEPVLTSKQASTIRDGYTLNQGAKALIVRVKVTNSNKYFAMLVLPGDKKFDANKVKKILSAKDVRFATEVEVSQITNGVKTGGVPPFGNLFNLEVIADKSLFENKKIIFNVGDRAFSIAMNSNDYLIIVKPDVHSIS